MDACEQLAAFFRSEPLPLATPEQVLEVPCTSCGAAEGEECSTAFPRPAFAAAFLFRDSSWNRVHLRRYLDKTGDTR